MRWAEEHKYSQWTVRYVRKFAWTPLWDDDARQWVWLEYVHVRQWYSTTLGWRDYKPADASRYAWMYEYPIVGDSRHAVGQD